MWNARCSTRHPDLSTRNRSSMRQRPGRWPRPTRPRSRNTLSTSRPARHSTAGSAGRRRGFAHMDRWAAPPVRRRRWSAARRHLAMAHLGARTRPGALGCACLVRSTCAARSPVDLDLDVPGRRRRRAWRRTASGRPWRDSGHGRRTRTSTSHQRFRPAALLVGVYVSEHREAIRLPVHDAEHSGLAAQPASPPAWPGRSRAGRRPSAASRRGAFAPPRRRLVRAPGKCRAARRRLETGSAHAQRQTRAIDRPGSDQPAERLRGGLVAPDDAQPLAVRARAKFGCRPGHSRASRTAPASASACAPGGAENVPGRDRRRHRLVDEPVGPSPPRGRGDALAVTASPGNDASSPALLTRRADNR